MQEWRAPQNWPYGGPHGLESLMANLSEDDSMMNYCICTENVSTVNNSKQAEKGMKEITENRQYCKQNICDPSIANCRLLIVPLEFRNMIGSVFCVDTKRGNSGEECARYRELCVVLWKMCGLEWASESKAENVLGVQQNWFGSWYMSFRLCTLCLMFQLMCLNNCECYINTQLLQVLRNCGNVLGIAAVIIWRALVWTRCSMATPCGWVWYYIHLCKFM